MSTLTTLIQHSSGSPSQSNQAGEKIKGIQIGNGEVKVSFFADDMISYVENLKEFTHTQKNILETINKYSKVVRYKMSLINITPINSILGS